MIKVEVIEITEKPNTIENIRIKTYNMLANSVANIIRENSGLTSCIIHPDHENIITVEAKEQHPKIEFTKYCCDTLKNSITFDIN